VAGDAAGAIAAFRRLQKPGEEARALERIAREPQQARALEQFRRAVERAPDARAALRDPRVLGVLATALGMPDAAGQPGLAQRALLADPTEPESLVNRLPDKRWKAAAETLRLDRRGIAALRDPELQARLAEGLRRARLREAQEASRPGLGDAMLFLESAPRAQGPYSVLGNPVLRRVVTTALGLPRELALQSVEAQARALEARLDLAKLREPREVQRLAERYLIARAGEAVGAGGSALPGFGTGAGLMATLFPPGGLRV